MERTFECLSICNIPLSPQAIKRQKSISESKIRNIIKPLLKRGLGNLGTNTFGYTGIWFLSSLRANLSLRVEKIASKLQKDCPKAILSQFFFESSFSQNTFFGTLPQITFEWLVQFTSNFDRKFKSIRTTKWTKI